MRAPKAGKAGPEGPKLSIFQNLQLDLQGARGRAMLICGFLHGLVTTVEVEHVKTQRTKKEKKRDDV